MNDDMFVSISTTDVAQVTTTAERMVVLSGNEIDFISTEKEHFVYATVTDVMQLTQGQMGPSSGGGGGSDIFILDVTPTSSGIVGSKTYVDGGPELFGCVSDTKNVRVHIGTGGGMDKYRPSVTIHAVDAVVTETSTKRWFTGYADIVLEEGENVITCASDAGGVDTVIINVLGAGPAILDITFGPYPGAQTELKAGDTITAYIETEPEATIVYVRAQGAAQATNYPVTGGQAAVPITISSASGLQPITVYAQNSFGTPGDDFVSPTLNLNQTYPAIGASTIAYASGKQALDVGDTGTVTTTIVNADSVTYTGTNLSIVNSGVYEPTKTVSTTLVGYSIANNFNISATRAANGATSTASRAVYIASTPPTASISIAGSPSRLLSSPSGQDYEIRITASQLLSSAPTLNASAGAWQGSWTYSGSYWRRNLRILDSTPKGPALFSGLSMVGLSGISGNTITAGQNYTVGGFTSRTVTFPAFSRVAPLGTPVADETKMSAQIGSQNLTRYTDNGVRQAGFYPANAAGAYDSHGSYIGLSDSAFAGSNTTGTLQATVQESV